jgi:tyrosine-protein phosphatase SIW14
MNKTITSALLAILLSSVISDCHSKSDNKDSTNTLLKTEKQLSLRTRPLNWAQAILGAESKNLYQIDVKLFRSAQPDDDQNHELVSLGIKDILNLREHHADNDDIDIDDITLHRVKMNAGEIKDQQIIAAMRIIKQAKGPVLVHCWHGSDRTGIVVAMYRILFQDWSKQQAIDELVNGGYGYHASFYPNIVEYIQQVDLDKIKLGLITDA